MTLGHAESRLSGRFGKRGYMRRVSGRVGTALLAASMAVPVAGLQAALTARGAGAAATTYANAAIVAPYNIAAGPDGALWFTNVNDDDSGSIGRITSTGTVTSFSDPSTRLGQPDPDGTPANPQGIALGPDGALWVANSGNDSIGRITSAGGVVTQYFDPSISGPADIAAGSDGALWFTNNNSDSIGRITSDGTVTNYTDATIAGPSGIAAGPDGALWFTNSDANSIGRITTAGTVTSYTSPSIVYPTDITAGPDGALWFVSFGDSDSNDSIGRVTTSGIVTVFTDPGVAEPAGIAVGPDRALWFTNTAGGFQGSGSIGRITTRGKFYSYVYPGMSFPLGITAGPDGAVWFTNDAVDGSASIGRITTKTPPTTVPERAARSRGCSVGQRRREGQLARTGRERSFGHHDLPPAGVHRQRPTEALVRQRDQDDRDRDGTEEGQDLPVPDRRDERGGHRSLVTDVRDGHDGRSEKAREHERHAADPGNAAGQLHCTGRQRGGDHQVHRRVHLDQGRCEEAQDRQDQPDRCRRSHTGREVPVHRLGKEHSRRRATIRPIAGESRIDPARFRRRAAPRVPVHRARRSDAFGGRPRPTPNCWLSARSRMTRDDRTHRGHGAAQMTIATRCRRAGVVLRWSTRHPVGVDPDVPGVGNDSSPASRRLPPRSRPRRHAAERRAEPSRSPRRHSHPSKYSGALGGR